MGVPSRAKRQVGSAAKAAAKQQRQAPDESRRMTLQEAATLNASHIVQHSNKPPPPPRPIRDLGGDADEGPGLVARLKAFLSLLGFRTDGIKSAQALSTPTRTHLERRLLANAETSRQHSPQQPNLITVPRPTPFVNIPTGQRPQRRLDLASRASKTISRVIRRKSPRPNVPLSTAGIDKLRRDLGFHVMGYPGPAPVADAVYVSIDTEGSFDVTEIGISTLDTRDIADIKPDHRATNWISRVKHQHFVIRRGPSSFVSPKRKLEWNQALFCTTQVDTAANARLLVLSTLRLARQPREGDPPRRVHLVGQSINGDVALMKHSQSLKLDLSNASTADFSFDSVYDTYDISRVAKSAGAGFGSMTLSALARALGVDAKYHTKHDGVVGWHNASNDAAYTIMVLLLFAVRWPTLARELKVQEEPAAGLSLNQLRVQLSETLAAKNAKTGSSEKPISANKKKKKKKKKRDTTMEGEELKMWGSRQERMLQKTWEQATLWEKAGVTLSGMLWGGKNLVKKSEKEGRFPGVK